MSGGEQRAGRPDVVEPLSPEVDRLRALADERAALLRVVRLVARAASPEDVVEAVVAEASRLLGGPTTTLSRFDGRRELVVVASHDADLAISFGPPATVSAPVEVAGAVWGMLTATSTAGPLPDGTERRLEPFAQLVAAAVGTSQARAELTTMADEQAALRRVAEVAARGASAEDVLAVVAVEGSRLSGVDVTMVLRYDVDGSTEVVALDGAVPGVTIGLRASSAGDGALQRLWRTGRVARVDDLATVPGHWPRVAREAGLVASLAVPILLEGTLWGALLVVSRDRPLPHGVEDHLVRFADLLGAAFSAVEVRLRLAEANAKLTASRARIVATADETRRRLQRDVHDGAQQRIVHALIALKMARTTVEAGSVAAGFVEEALTNVERAGSELRDIVHGILPRSLSYGGLRVGLESLVADLALPVDVHATTRRLPTAVETTAFFVVAEALTNAVKHSQARAVVVDVDLAGDTLVVEVRDDGVGGADPSRGSGLTGLLDRVDAAAGSFTISSPVGEGTTVRAELPVGPGDGHAPAPP